VWRETSRHGWLPAVVPASALRFRVADHSLAEWLRAAGAQLVDSGADVEIGLPEELVGEAETVVVPLRDDPPRPRIRGLRAAVRLWRFARLRTAAARVRRRLARQGYPLTQVIGWEAGHALLLPDAEFSRLALAPAERAPLAALVVGRRRGGDSTALKAALAAAAAGAPLAPARIKSTGVIVVPLERGVLRVGLGPAAAQVVAQTQALTALLDLRISSRLEDLVPLPLGQGEVGLSRWSLERRLPGAAPRGPLERRLLAECLGVLADLHRLRAAGSRRTMEHCARQVAAAASHAQRAGLVDLGRRLDRGLGHLPVGFAHGDFWGGNLLVESGRLSGIVDWGGSGPGRLPFLDLFHLLATESSGTGPFDVGAAARQYLLPLVRRGGGPYVGSYARETGLPLEAETLELLAFAYWLDRLAHDLRATVSPAAIAAQAEELISETGGLLTRRIA